MEQSKRAVEVEQSEGGCMESRDAGCRFHVEHSQSFTQILPATPLFHVKHLAYLRGLC